MSRIAAFVLLSLLGAGSSAMANLEETEETARTRSQEWRLRYAAIDGLFTPDENGLVIQECWPAPPEPWTEEAALRFALELLPGATEKVPKLSEVDGALRHYSMPDGSEIILMKGIAGGIIMVEVRAKRYKGAEC